MTVHTHLPAASNEANLERGLDFLSELMRARMADEKGAEATLPKLLYFDDTSPFAALLKSRQPTFDEYTILLLALAPHLRPTLLDNEIRSALERDGDFPEIGGIRDAASRTFLPTGETAAFLLAGEDLEARFAVQELFSPDHWFAREGILKLEPAPDGAPLLSGRIVMAREWVERFTLGTHQAPVFGSAFPARLVATDLDWDDLVLPNSAREQIEELEAWVRHHRSLADSWGMGRRLRPGYRALFHGPPGTGKTLTATLLGKSTGRPVYRIDLSLVVSKYIGETEKNLAALFDRAANREWILFFDEADALFGKRTGVKDAHDRYANQEVSYLLQRVEDFDGLVVLSSNFRANIDDAFLRRFNAIIRFPLPTPEERRQIWLRTLPERGDRSGLAEQLARFDLSGGNIVNIVQFAAIAAIADGRETILLEDALRGVQREVEKEGKVFTNVLAE
jgi:hypothetical protein